MSTAVETGIEVVPTTEHTDDDDHHAHYARKEDILASATGGTVIIALCGYRLQAKRDYTKFPVCEECKELLEILKGMSSS